MDDDGAARIAELRRAHEALKEEDPKYRKWAEAYPYRDNCFSVSTVGGRVNSVTTPFDLYVSDTFWGPPKSPQAAAPIVKRGRRMGRKPRK